MATKIRHVKAVIQLRRATENEWYNINPILRVGEPALSTDVYRLKIGDGETDWRNLPYLFESEFEEFLETLEQEYATKEYVDEYGGKIDSITINGIEQVIDENKNVELDIPEYQAGNGIQINEVGGEETLLKKQWNHDFSQSQITFNFNDNLEVGKKYKYVVGIGYNNGGQWKETTKNFIFVWNRRDLFFKERFYGEEIKISVYEDHSIVKIDFGEINGYTLELYEVAPTSKEISLDDLLIDCGTSTTVI